MKRVTSEKVDREVDPDDYVRTTLSGDQEEDGATARKPARLRRMRRILLIAGPLAVVVLGGYFYFAGGRYVGTENAYVKADKVMIAAEVSGLISDVAVRENQHVKKGDVLFRVDDKSYRIALQEAEARLAGTAGEIAGLKASYHEQGAELALAQSNLDFAQREFDRQSRLVASNAISRSTFDTAKHNVDIARQRIRVTEQEQAQIRAQLAGDPDIPVERHPSYLAAKAARDNAALNLERTVVRAPFAGIAGATPQTGKQVTGNGPLSSPVMNIVGDSGFWIEANYKETDLTNVRPGQPVSIYIDTYPDHEWSGTVDSLSQATGAEFSVIPPQNATGNWVKIVQRITVRITVEANGDDPPLRAGMSAYVEIDTGNSRAAPGVMGGLLSWTGLAPRAGTARADARP